MTRKARRANGEINMTNKMRWRMPSFVLDFGLCRHKKKEEKKRKDCARTLALKPWTVD